MSGLARRYCCTRCGSTHVYCDAWVALNEEDDDMAFDATHCEACEGECKVEFREVDLEDR